MYLTVITDDVSSNVTCNNLIKPTNMEYQKIVASHTTSLQRIFITFSIQDNLLFRVLLRY